MFFGRLIKAAVSRQREYLADASSVQFTRNPDGIGGALRKIGGLTQQGQPGSRIDHPNAEALSHLFLGAARPSFVAGLFATHPPLSARIRRIYGRDLPMLPAGELPLAETLAQPGGRPVADRSRDGPAAALSPLAALVGDDGRSDRVTEAIGSVSVAEAFGVDAAQQVDALHDAVQRLPPGLRLSLLDRAEPTLLKLPAAARERLLLLAHGLVRADGRVTLHEFLLFTVLKRRIGRDASRPVRVRFPDIEPLQADVGLVMSLLASVRLPERPEHAYNAGVLLLSGIDPPRVPTEAIDLDEVSRALDRLNELAPLAKPRLIKACAAVAYVDGRTHWKAASCLRTICAALDSPLPPQLLGGDPAEPSQEMAEQGRQDAAGQQRLLPMS